MSCLSPSGNSNVCLMQQACPKVNGSSQLAYIALPSTCVYKDSSTVNYYYAFPAEGGTGMTQSQLDALLASDQLGVFAVVMVIFVIGLALGFRWTSVRSTYGGDA